MPWLAGMEVLWCLNQNNYTVDEAAGENIECHMEKMCIPLRFVHGPLVKVQNSPMSGH